MSFLPSFGKLLEKITVQRLGSLYAHLITKVDCLCCRNFWGCGCPELALWKSFFHGRKAFIEDAIEHVWVKVESEKPQGPIAVSLIWNLKVDEMLGELSSAVECVAYEDDLLIIVQGNNRLEINGVLMVSCQPVAL